VYARRRLVLGLTRGGGSLLSMKTRVDTFVYGVCVAALFALLASWSAAPSASSIQVQAAACLAILGLIAELLSYELPNGAAGSTSFIPFLAAVLVSGSWVAVAFIGTATLLVQLLHRRAFIKAAFNTAQFVLSAASAVLAYMAAGGSNLLHAVPASFSALWRSHGYASGVAIVSFLMLNYLAVSGVLALTSNRSVSNVVLVGLRNTATYTLISAPLALALAWVYAKYGAVWSVAITLPLLGVRQLYWVTLQLRRNNQELLELMVKAIEARDPYTSGHSRRVSQTAQIIARAAALSEVEVERVRMAALLHDVGKIHEDYAPILRKPGKLTNEEWELMKTHPDRGADLVATMSHLSDLVAPIRHHHERWDGEGYPAGLTAESIPFGSRIITIADTLDALTSDRPYRSGLTQQEVRSEFIRCRGAQFDPELIDRVLAPAVWQQLFESSKDSRPVRLRRVL
jgi:putative nucleotidyltransferase with HDIG domain